jgi:hypothetical protein
VGRGGSKVLVFVYLLSWKRSGRTLNLAAVMSTHSHRGRSSMLVRLGEGEGNLDKWKCSKSVVDAHLHVN